MVAIVIVPSALKLLAERAVRQLAPESAGESFIVPLVSIGQAGPASHWACLPIVSAATLEQIRQMVQNRPFAPSSVLASSEAEVVPEVFENILREQGLEREATA